MCQESILSVYETKCRHDLTYIKIPPFLFASGIHTLHFMSLVVFSLLTKLSISKFYYWTSFENNKEEIQ